MTVKHLNANPQGLQLALFGDSLTFGSPGAAYVDYLAELLPGFQLHNYGKGGDTVISLNKRIGGLEFNESFDVAVIQVGVNDVFVQLSWFYPILKRLMGQPWAKTPGQFEEYYAHLLFKVTGLAKAVVTVPPLLVGERLDNPYNLQLFELSAIIQSVSGDYEQVTFVDPREQMVAEIQGGGPVSDYLPRSARQVAADVRTLKSTAAIDERARQRGLGVTLDGIHLNSTGARVVAQQLAEVIGGLGE